MASHFFENQDSMNDQAFLIPSYPLSNFSPNHSVTGENTTFIPSHNPSKNPLPFSQDFFASSHPFLNCSPIDDVVSPTHSLIFPNCNINPERLVGGNAMSPTLTSASSLKILSTSDCNAPFAKSFGRFAIALTNAFPNLYKFQVKSPHSIPHINSTIF